MPDESRLQSAIDVYTSLDRSITHAKLYGEDSSFATIEKLEELKDEAFRMIEMNTTEHLFAFEELIKELNLVTQ